MKDAILKGIADNPQLMEELKTLLIGEFETPTVEVGYSNERLGEMVKARLLGVQAIERAFNKILEYKTLEPKQEIKHPGR